MKRLLVIFLVLGMLVTPLVAIAADPIDAPGVEEIFDEGEETPNAEETPMPEPAPAGTPAAGTAGGCIPNTIANLSYVFKLTSAVMDTETELSKMGGIMKDVSKDKQWMSKREAREKIIASGRSTRVAAVQLQALPPGVAETKPLHSAAMKFAGDLIGFLDEFISAMEELNKPGQANPAVLKKMSNALDKLAAAEESEKALVAQLEKVKMCK